MNCLLKTSIHADLRGHGFRPSATIKMELFDQVPLYLGVLKRKTIVLVTEANNLYRV